MIILLGLIAFLNVAILSRRKNMQILANLASS